MVLLSFIYIYIYIGFNASELKVNGWMGSGSKSLSGVTHCDANNFNTCKFTCTTTFKAFKVVLDLELGSNNVHQPAQFHQNNSIL